MDSRKEALEAIKRDLKNPLELRGTMEQAVRSALSRVEALLTAEPEPCASSNYSDIPNSSRLPEHYGAGDLVDDLREDERSTSGRMEAPREYVLSYPEACSLVNRYASQVAAKQTEGLREEVKRLKDEYEYSEQRLTTSYCASESLREQVAGLKADNDRLRELLEEYRRELITTLYTHPDKGATSSRDDAEADILQDIADKAHSLRIEMHACGATERADELAREIRKTALDRLAATEPKP